MLTQWTPERQSGESCAKACSGDNHAPSMECQSRLLVCLAGRHSPLSCPYEQLLGDHATSQGAGAAGCSPRAAGSRSAPPAPCHLPSVPPEGGPDRAFTQTLLRPVHADDSVEWEQSTPKTSLSLISFKKHTLGIFKWSVFQNFSHNISFLTLRFLHLVWCLERLQGGTCLQRNTKAPGPTNQRLKDCGARRRLP